MAPQSPLLFRGNPQSSETEEQLSARAVAGLLTKEDFKYFVAFLYEGETSAILEDLKPITEIEFTPEPGDVLAYYGEHRVYSFSENDVETILQRWYSEEEIGMYGIRHTYRIILNKAERSYLQCLAIFELREKSSKDVDLVYQKVINIIKKQNIGNAEGQRYQPSQVILPLALAAFGWLFM